MACRKSLVGALVVWLSLAATAFAQNDPLDAIPESALGVMVLNRPAETNARINKLIQAMQLPETDVLELLQAGSGALAGVDTSRALAIAMFSADDGDPSSEPTPVIYIPVGDYAAFLAAMNPTETTDGISKILFFGDDSLVANRGSFALVCEGTDRAVLKRVLVAERSVRAGIEPLRDWMDQQQFALVLTPAGKQALTKTITDAIDEGIKGLESLASEAAEETQEVEQEVKDAEKQDAAKKNEENAEEQSEELDVLGPTEADYQSILQAMKSARDLFAASAPQLSQLGLGVRIDDPAAVHVAVRAMYSAESGLGRWAAKVQVPPKGVLAGLPPNRFVFAYGGVTADLSPALSDLTRQLNEANMKILDSDESLLKKYSEAVAAMQANQISSAGLFGQMRPGDSMISATIVVERVKNAKEHMANTRQMFESLYTAFQSSKTGANPFYTVHEATVGELSALELVVDLKSILEAPADDPTGIAQGLMSRLFGAGGQAHMYVAAADDQTVVTAYSRELLQRGVEHVRSQAAGLEADPGIGRTASLLPRPPQWSLYINAQGLLQWTDELMRGVLPPELNFRIPAFPASDPLGMAVKATPTTLDAELVLPPSLVQAIGQYIKIVQKAIEGGELQLP